MIKVKDLIQTLHPWTKFILFNFEPHCFIGMFDKENTRLKPYLNKNINNIDIVDMMLKIEIKGE